MVLPPATPAASRFLASKRQSTQQSQSQTPSQQHGGGPPRFHATPRFAACTPRPSSAQTAPHFATPALVIKPRVPRNRSTQDIIDDSSPISPEGDLPPQPPSAWKSLPEPIEFDSSLGVPQSSSPEGFNEGRSPKRRRISIASSEPDVDSVAHSQGSDEASLGSLPDAPGDHIASYHSDIDVDDDEDTKYHENEAENEDDDPIPPISQPISSPLRPRHSSPIIEPDPTSSPSPSSSPSDTESESEPDLAHSKPQATTKPPPRPFHPAPRFIPLSPRSHSHPSHPTALLNADIFSPRRRGTTYLPGGLAAELRDWLVEVKGGVDSEGVGGMARSEVLGFGGGTVGGGGVVRVVVEGVERGGAGMTLVEGRVGEEGKGVRVILAGEGRIEGLGGGGRGGGNWERVVPGAVVAVALPTWDVELDGRWTVAYRWEVVEAGG
ncbi:hypothetical protein C8A05DRAFT_43006 [Staphylotrichum tortipilum]|uniref:Uncharacterized protein n=1 Tax=Staphylotrichum tortipilum TaxID=2831512 RepID=A0AAN6MPT5_9PEZI|nr:hypothetical protein C8A05DRAFT_43006 [Staphylotrichum longicolle]